MLRSQQASLMLPYSTDRLHLHTIGFDFLLGLLLAEGKKSENRVAQVFLSGAVCS